MPTMVTISSLLVLTSTQIFTKADKKKKKIGSKKRGASSPHHCTLKNMGPLGLSLQGQSLCP